MDNIMRPGINVSCVLKPNQKNIYKSIFIAAKIDTDNSNTLYEITSLSYAKSLFGENSEMTSYVKAILSLGDIKIYATGINKNSNELFNDYKKAADVFLIQDTASLFVSDNNTNEFLSYIKSTKDKTENKLFFFNMNGVESLQEYANNINFERILLAYPKITLNDNNIDISNCILAVLVALNNNMLTNYFSSRIVGDFNINTNMTEEEKNNCLYNGISVFEKSSSNIELIRMVTTKTYDDADNTKRDFSLRNIQSVITKDYILSDLKRRLYEKIKNNSAELDSLETEIRIALKKYSDLKLITDYKINNIYIDKNDTETAVVDLEITILKSVSRISLNVNIEV